MRTTTTASKLGRRARLALRHVRTVVPLAALASCEHVPRAEPRHDAPARVLEFRAMVAGYPAVRDPGFWDRASWERRMSAWSEEGFETLVSYGPNELTSGENVLARHGEFPEAAELVPPDRERIAEHFRWLFRTARELGLRSLLLTQHVFYTGALGRAHGLDALPASPSVGRWHADGYPDFWRGGVTRNCGVWNETTRACVESLYAELPGLYPDLAGFYGFLGEPVPGERARIFAEAIAPGLARSGRRPLFVANQWQVPLESYLRHVADPAVYDHTWLGFHGYNSETLTDAKPYPAVVSWSEATGLPTVLDVYPGNCLVFPLNSPRAARGFLEAFDLAARITPEKDALVYSGGDVLRKIGRAHV